MSAAFGIVFVSIDDEEKARQIARTLVEERLAACVQISPIFSIYRWQGKAEDSNEFRLDIKMRAADYPALEERVRQLHPYDTPEIVRIDIVEGYRPYLDWLGDGS